MDKITDNERTALYAFAVNRGVVSRGWKAELRKAWDTGAYYRSLHSDHVALLQHLRNSRGPRWLARFKF
jgi:hypothetical protein